MRTLRWARFLMILRLCEYAAANADGTFTIIRGGIEFWNTKQVPIPVELWLVIEMEPRSLSKGESPLSIMMNTTEGEEILSVQGVVGIPSSDQVTRLPIPIRFVASSYGGIVIRCRVGEHAGQLDLGIREQKG